MKKQEDGFKKERKFPLQERVNLSPWDDSIKKIIRIHITFLFFHGSWRFCNNQKGDDIFPWCFLLNTQLILNDEETKCISEYSFIYILFHLYIFYLLIWDTSSHREVENLECHINRICNWEIYRSYFFI